MVLMKSKIWKVYRQVDNSKHVVDQEFKDLSICSNHSYIDNLVKDKASSINAFLRLRLLHTRVTSSKYFEKRNFFILDEACIFFYIIWCDIHIYLFQRSFIKIELFITTLNSYIYETKCALLKKLE